MGISLSTDLQNYTFGGANVGQKPKEKSQVYGFQTLAIIKSDSRGIQTHNLLIRSQMLYSVELGSLP